MTHRKGVSRLYGFLAVVFFVSGGAGLVYEVVWSRMMLLVFGSTTHAVSAVIGVYMLGLALGAYACGRVAHRVRRPMLVYGILEGLIGTYALSFPVLLEWVQSLHSVLFPELYAHLVPLSLARILLALCLLIVPTTLMGATLPLLSQYLARTGRMARDVGGLYFLNTVGAALGTFCAAFALIPHLGLDATILVGAACNLGLGAVVAIAAVRVERRGDADADTAEAPAPDGLSASEAPDVDAAQARTVALAFAASGFFALVLEVAWSRALILVFGSSVYSFSTMLATFLTGIALGSLAMGRVADRSRDPVALFGLVCAAMGVTALATTPLVGMLPDFMVRSFDPGSGGWGEAVFLQFGMSFLVMLAPTLCSGALFPVAARVMAGAVSGSGGVGRAVGRAYAYNTVGGILGSLATGFVCIPLLGVETSLDLAGLGCALLGVVVVWTAGGRAVPVRVVRVAALLIPAVALLFLPSWDVMVLNQGAYRDLAGKAGEVRESGAQLAEVYGDVETLYYREGTSATVAVTRKDGGVLEMQINGKTDGGTGIDSLTQVLLGVVPMLYVNDAEAPGENLVIGLATGMTLGAMLQFPSASVDCIEISPAVIEASHYFDEYNGRPLQDPRTKLRVLDGRTWLMAMPVSYDVISSEVSNPWQTGNANLFTRDFHRLAKKRLAKGGIYCQWLPMYDLSPEHYRILLSTFLAEYRYAHVWMFMTDTIVIGSDSPLRVDPARLDRAMSAPGLASVMRGLGVGSREDLLAFFYLDTERARMLAGDAGPVNTDAFPLIEFESPKYVLRSVPQNDLLMPIMALAKQSALPVPAMDNQAGRAALWQSRYVLYRRMGIPDAVLRQVLSAQ